MIKKLSAIDLLPYAWLLFLIGTCLSPRFKDLNNIFYLTFLPLTLIALRQYYAELIRTPIVIWLLALSGWMALSSTWALDPDYTDLKAIGYVIIFIAGCALIEETKVIAKWGGLIPIAMGIQLYFSTIPGQRLLGFGPMENPLYAGQFYLFFTWFFLYYKQFHSKPTISVIIRWVGFFMSIGACILTQSRSVVFCIPILILMILLPQNLIRHYKKLVLAVVTLIIAGSIALFFNNKWVTLPSKNFNYQISLDAGETVHVRYINAARPNSFPTIETPKNITATLQQNSKPSKFSFTAEQAGDYRLDISLNKKTITPWRSFLLYSKKPNESLLLKKKFMPPRALRFELSFGYRTEIWPIRLQQCLEKPLFGHGFSQSSPIPFKSGYVNDSHNFFLGTAFQGGIIALVIYTVLLLVCLYTLSNKKYWPFAVLILCGIITTSFDDEKFFSSTRPYWLLLLFPIGKALKASLNHQRASHKNVSTEPPDY